MTPDVARKGQKPVALSFVICYTVPAMVGRRGQEVKAGVCKTPIQRFESARRLQKQLIPAIDASLADC